MNYKFPFFIILVLIAQFSFSQTRITGKVIDKNTGDAIVGANIIVSNTNIGSISDESGAFVIKTEDSVKTLICSFVGYKTENIENPAQNITIYLSPSVSELDEVVVKSVYTKPVKRTSDAIYTGSALTSKGISMMGISASNSVYNAIDLMPGVNVESNDAYGLSDKSVRIRCVKDNFSGMTIDGFPNYGIMPIGARDDIYDMENMQQIAVYKGATPADLGTATGSKGGALELQYKRPQDNFGVQLCQSVGMNNYTRTFARLDLGTLPTKTGVFMSYSFTRTDKWKGEGELGPRNNAAIGITQSLGKNTKLELFANYNDIDRHDFRALTYDEADNIDDNFDLDFNSSLTGTPAEDMYYYDYNKGNFVNKDIMATLSHNLDQNQKLSFKYYYSLEDADYNEGVKKSTNYFVFNRVRDINRMGIIPEYSGSVKNISYSAGYWFESSDNNAFVYSSRITADGIVPVGYSYYTVHEKKGQVHSPYAKVSYKKEKLSFQAGLKYFYYLDPESERYTSESATELSTTPDSDLHTKEMTHSALLPTFGAGFKFSEKLEAYINYGKNYMRPYMYSPIISLFVKNQQTFTDNNMTLQSIFDKWEMETSDNFDLGVRFTSGKFVVSPSLFYAKHHNVLAAAYDETVQLDYYQNVGELTAYGADMECYIFPVKGLMIFINPTYNKMSYDDNLVRKSSDGSEDIDIEGNQAPATPLVYLKTGAAYTIKGFDIAAKVKHVGVRYGDATNIEEIPAYTLVDASVGYTKENVWKLKALCVGFELKNILNTKYVGGIDVSDDSVEGDASYYAGIPFTAVGKLSVKF